MLKMHLDNQLIAELRDHETRKIVSDLQLDAGVNIFYHVNRKKTDPTRFSPSREVGRKQKTAYDIGYEITDHGNWIEMEELGVLKPAIERAELDLSRVIYARDWDDYCEDTYPIFSGGEITDITSAGRGGIIHRSPIEFSGTRHTTDLTCGFVFYSLTASNRLRRDEFTSRAVAERGSNSHVSNIWHQQEIRGSGIGLFRLLSNAMGRWEKDYPFDKEAWKLYNRLFQK